jgi:hypothetical protein
MIIPAPKFGACLGSRGTLVEPHLNVELSVRGLFGVLARVGYPRYSPGCAYLTYVDPPPL